MNSMSTFQIAVTALFIMFTIIGVGIFAIFGGALGGRGIGAVTVWGTAPQAQMSLLLETLRTSDKTLQDVQYIEKDADTFSAELLNAMASDTGPDLFLIPQEDINAFADKIIPIPYGTVSQSTFVTSYIDEAQLFLTPQGALALPFSIDPIIMYWNRDLFAGAGIAQPPSGWNEFLNISPKITSLDSTKNFVRSAVALGEWQNIRHAKSILSALFMQAGDPIVVRQGNGLASVFGADTENSAASPAESALRFYTEFANPAKSTYSWNKSLPRSDNAFVSGELAVYFGLASEYQLLADRNPNLRFSVSVIPQLSGNSRLTYGVMDGLAIPRTARNAAGAMVAAQKLTSREGASALFQITGLPPVRRDLTIDTSNSIVTSIFIESALIARGWQDPSPKATNDIFQTMIESVVSGRAQPVEAVGEASLEMNQLIPRQ